MPDREKVIRGLATCGGDDPDCQNCPYYGEHGNGFGCETIMQRDALVLLKAQEPVKAYRLHGEKVIDNGEKVFTGYCDNCCCYLVDGWKACPACGKAVIWND